MGKAVNLAHSVNVEVLGLVENMAFFNCDDCGKKHCSRLTVTTSRPYRNS